MSVSIREGFRVESTETERVKKLKDLEKIGILTLKETFTQKCNRCNHPNRVSKRFRTEQRSTCQQCEKVILFSQKRLVSEITVTKVNYKKIIQICDSKFKRELGRENCKYDRYQRVWICSVENKKIPIFILNVSSYVHYIKKDLDTAWLCILVDWQNSKNTITYYNERHFIKIEDIIEDTIDIEKKLNQQAIEFKSNITITLAEKFDVYIDSISPTEFRLFEKEFVDKFLEEIKRRKQKFEEFLDYLSSRDKTIVNGKVIQLGGAGNPDFIIFNLFEYLQEGLRPNKVGEVKRYFRKTQFSVEDFAKAIYHARDQDTLSIISTNNIAPDVWCRVWETRQKTGKFKHVIFEKDTILLLIEVLKMEFLLEA